MVCWLFLVPWPCWLQHVTTRKRHKLNRWIVIWWVHLADHKSRNQDARWWFHVVSALTKAALLSALLKNRVLKYKRYIFFKMTYWIYWSFPPCRNCSILGDEPPSSKNTESKQKQHFQKHTRLAFWDLYKQVVSKSQTFSSNPWVATANQIHGNGLVNMLGPPPTGKTPVVKGAGAGTGEWTVRFRFKLLQGQDAKRYKTISYVFKSCSHLTFSTLGSCCCLHRPK